jgi:hypothetical protein
VCPLLRPRGNDLDLGAGCEPQPLFSMVTWCAQQPATFWQGYLLGVSLRHGPLSIPVLPRDEFWYGSPEVHPQVRVTAFFPNGHIASTIGRVLLHPGFG